MKTLKVWLVLLLVFVAGFTGGVVATRVVVRKMVQAAIRHPELVRHRIELNLDRRLRLDAQQREQVRQILTDTQGRLKDLRKEFQPQLVDILQETRKKISAVLTPEQQKRFDDYLAERPLGGVMNKDGGDTN
jgi:hypothetical protein